MKNTKLTSLAATALREARYDAMNMPAIAALAAFAAQRSGLDWRNYYSVGSDRSGRAALQADHRGITNDWRNFKRSLLIAASEGVTDREVIAEAPHAYCGRLAWNGRNWDYCTGQYFPTEYRRAAIAVLEHAIRRVRQNRQPARAKIHTIAELRVLNRQNGGCWFEPATMRFFGTRIESRILRGRYFLTSEQPPHGARGFTLRSFDDTGSIDTIGELCGYRTGAEALAALHRIEAKEVAS